MPNYSIGLSGLMTSSESMNVISNNIANASTVGYRAGDFIFEDQFYKAMNPLDKARSGMGDAKQNIRRFWNMGAIQASANTLDMAITGSMGACPISLQQRTGMPSTGSTTISRPWTPSMTWSWISMTSSIWKSCERDCCRPDSIWTTCVPVNGIP